MDNRICEMFGIEFPILAFTHCRDVVAAVTNAGGFGVLGAVGFSPEQLEIELNWIDEHIGDRPYGVDIVIPNKYEGMDTEMSGEELGEMLRKMVPQQHLDFARNLLLDHGVPLGDAGEDNSLQLLGWTEAERRAYGQVLDRYYSFIDGEVGRALGVLKPDDLLLVVARGLDVTGERGVGDDPVLPAVARPDGADIGLGFGAGGMGADRAVFRRERAGDRRGEPVLGEDRQDRPADELPDAADIGRIFHGGLAAELGAAGDPVEPAGQLHRNAARGLFRRGGDGPLRRLVRHHRRAGRPFDRHRDLGGRAAAYRILIRAWRGTSRC